VGVGPIGGLGAGFDKLSPNGGEGLSYLSPNGSGVHENPGTPDNTQPLCNKEIHVRS